MLLRFYIIFTLFYITNCIDINHIADACKRLIQPPSSNSDTDMLLRTLDVNCIHYYNLHVDEKIVKNLTSLYETSIQSAKQYQNAYTQNEHEQYNARSWLSMVASDPLSIIQRQAKECNAHILKSFIGNEDIVRAGDVFLKSLKYMNLCFKDTLEFSKRQKNKIEEDFDHRISLVDNASLKMKQEYMQMNHDHETLMDFRDTYKNNIVSNYEKIFIDSLKN